MTSTSANDVATFPAASTGAAPRARGDWSTIMVGRPHVYCPAGCETTLTWEKSDQSEHGVCMSCGARYPLESNVLFLERGASEADFPASAAAAFARIESTHFRLRGRKHIVRSIMGTVSPTDRPPFVLDVGCGTGTMSAWLQQLGYTTVGLDVDAAGLRHAAQRLGTLQVCCNPRSMPFRGAFDYVTLFDALERTDDDVSLLQTCRRALRPDGSIVLTVPADMRLWSPYDELFGHKRRYTRRQLVEVCRAASLEVHRIRYCSALLWPIQYLARRWPSARTTKVEPTPETIRRFLTPPPAPLNTFLAATMRLEASCLTYIAPPFGAALIALARKTDK